MHVYLASPATLSLLVEALQLTIDTPYWNEARPKPIQNTSRSTKHTGYLESFIQIDRYTLRSLQLTSAIS